MSNIILMASGDSIAYWGKQLQKELAGSEHLSIVMAYMEQAVEYARHSLPDDADVIIARGNTAKLLKASKLSIPVVTIPIRDFELIQSLETAKKLYGEKDAQIAYIGMEDVIHSVSNFLDLLHRKIKLYSVESSRDIYESIIRAKREKVSIVIGGIYTKILAEENGLKCVLLESSLPSLKEAYDRALEVRKGVYLQRKKLQERITMMNAITEGIVGINEKGRITIYNTSAEIFFQIPSADVLNKSYSSLFEDSEKSIINRMLLYGDEVIDHTTVIHGSEFILDFHPVTIQKKNKGIIISLRQYRASGKQPASVVQETMDSGSEPYQFSGLVGEHPAFLTAKSMAVTYAACPLPVLLIGENGTGKTAFARCIHYSGPRQKELFLIRDGELLTSEDFLSVHRGTLYIRNIENISPHMSATLIDLLETHSILLPDHNRRPVDVRIIAGSSANLSQILAPRLYYNLNTFILPLPALRQRDGDCGLLFSFFLEAYNRIHNKNCIPPDNVDEILNTCTWTGNIQQLKNLCQRLVCLNTGILTGDSLKTNLDDSVYYFHLIQNQFSISDCSIASSVKKEGFVINKQLVTYDELKALDKFYQGHKGMLAQRLGISRSTLWRYFKLMDEEKTGQTPM